MTFYFKIPDMSQKVIPEVESPVEATEAETVKTDEVPQQSQVSFPALAKKETIFHVKLFA